MNRPFTQIEMQYLIGKYGTYPNVAKRLSTPKTKIPLRNVLAKLRVGRLHIFKPTLLPITKSTNNERDQMLLAFGEF